MDFLDALSKGLDRLADKLDSYSDRRAAEQGHRDTSFSVLEKDYCWEDLDYAGDLVLQRHIVNGFCRIVDQYGTIVDHGLQPEMEASLRRRAEQLRAAYQASTQLSGIVQEPVQAQYGDIIGVVRKNGMYEHYGIYVSDTCIVHYGIPATQSHLAAQIHCTSLRYFLKDDTDYFVLDFPKPYQPPVRIQNGVSPVRDEVSEQLARTLQQTYGYHLYSPEETVARARSRIGEEKFNLITNNCEHFAIWCKTGVNESIQVNGMLSMLTGHQNWKFHKSFCL